MHWMMQSPKLRNTCLQWVPIINASTMITREDCLKKAKKAYFVEIDDLLQRFDLDKIKLKPTPKNPQPRISHSSKYQHGQRNNAPLRNKRFNFDDDGYHPYPIVQQPYDTDRPVQHRNNRHSFRSSEYYSYWHFRRFRTLYRLLLCVNISNWHFSLGNIVM